MPRCCQYKPSAGIVRVAAVRNHRPRKIQGPATGIGHHLHPAGIGGERRIERRRRGADVVPLLHPAQRSGQGLPREKRLVALNVHNDVERGELRVGRDLGHPLSTGLVATGGQDRPDPGLLRHLGHLRRNRWPPPAHQQPMLQHALDDPGDEWLTCQRAEAVCWGGGWSRDEPE